MEIELDALPIALGFGIAAVAMPLVGNACWRAVALPRPAARAAVAALAGLGAATALAVLASWITGLRMVVPVAAEAGTVLAAVGILGAVLRRPS